MADTSHHVVVFLGSCRPGRMAERVGIFVKKTLIARGYKVSVVDPLELQLPVLEMAHYHYRGDAKPPEKLDQVANIIGSADGFVVVSGEYNHSIPPALTNTMSHFGSSKYMYKPCAMVNPFGGVRAAMQLRSFLGELGCLTTSAILAFPEVQKLLSEDGTPLEAEVWDNRAKRCFDQLHWVLEACKSHRQVTPIPQ